MTLHSTDIFNFTRKRFNPEHRDQIDYITELLSDYLPQLTDGDGHILIAKLERGDISVRYCVFDFGQPLYSTISSSNLLSYLRHIVHYSTDNELRKKYKEQLRRVERGL